MQEPHIHIKDKQQEIKITILERTNGQPYEMDDNYFLPVKIEYKSNKVCFVKELIYLDTYEFVSFYCSLNDIAIGYIVNQGFFFAEPYIDFVLEKINGKILFTLRYKENEEDIDRIEVKQMFTERQFEELIEKVHQGCNLWIDDSELIEFREYLDDLEDNYYDYISSGYRVAEVEFLNSGKFYYYLCDDENIKNGDLVVVPSFFGKESIARVVNIEYYNEDVLPYSLDKMKKVIKKHVKPLSKKINIHSHDITENGFGFELLVNFVIKKGTKAEFSIKDKNAYFSTIFNEYVDVYLDVYKEMLVLKPSEMRVTKGLWIRAEKVLHVGFVEQRKDLKKLFFNILDKAKELKKHWVGIPCVLEKYHGISPKTIFKIALKVAKEWIIKNESYDMEILFCCPKSKLYKKFEAYYKRKIRDRI